jgi:multidrug efflux system outer membrane protein
VNRVTSKYSLLIVVLTVVLFGSCTLHPPYRRPCVEVPETWRIPVDESLSYCNYGWWEQFGDPQLNGLILEALEQNKDLKVAIARVYQFMGQLQVVNSAFYPQINATGSGSRQEVPVGFSPLPLEIKRTSDDFILQLNASYELDIWGSIRSASESALAQLFAQVEARRTVVLTLVSSVASSYIELKQFYKQLDISRQTHKSRSESYDLALVRYHGGLTSELEPKQAKAEMETAAAQVIQFERLIALQENLISVLIGHPPQSIDSGLSLDELYMAFDVPAGIPSQILGQRPDILQAEWNLISANAEIGVARAQFFPNISLTGFYGNESFELSSLFTGPSRMWLYGVAFLQPIFTGGMLIGQLNVAEAEKWEAYYQYQQVVLTAFKEADDALISHQKSLELLKVTRLRVEALVDALSLATLQYNNGQVDYLNVLDAQTKP